MFVVSLPACFCQVSRAVHISRNELKQDSWNLAKIQHSTGNCGTSSYPTEDSHPLPLAEGILWFSIDYTCGCISKPMQAPASLSPRSQVLVIHFTVPTLSALSSDPHSLYVSHLFLYLLCPPFSMLPSHIPYSLCPCLSQGFAAVHRHHDLSNSCKDNIYLGLAYRFRGSVHYHQGRNMEASRQAWCRQS